MTDLVFSPECLNCGSKMEEVRALGLAMEGGSIYCPKCNEHHNYHIFKSEMILKRVSVPVGYTGQTERKFYPLEKMSKRKVSITFDVILPISTPPIGEVYIYIAGNFNNWDSCDRKLNRTDDVHADTAIESLEGESLEYKYTLGSWKTVERKSDGSDIKNRTLDVVYEDNGCMEVKDTIERWSDVKCSLCGAIKSVNQMKFITEKSQGPEKYEWLWFCKDACWPHRGKIVGSRKGQGCPYWTEGICKIPPGFPCSLEKGSYLSCYVYRGK